MYPLVIISRNLFLLLVVVLLLLPGKNSFVFSLFVENFSREVSVELLSLVSQQIDSPIYDHA